MANNESHGIEFKKAAENSGLTKSAIGRAVGASPQSVRNWGSRGVPSKYALTVAQVLGISAELISDIVVESHDPATRAHLAPCYNEDGEQVASFLVDDMNFPGAKRIALLIVTCNAMEPEVARGNRVFFDEGTAPNPGDIAVAKDPDGKIILRKYREVDTDGTFQLVPLSSDWPTITSNNNGGYTLAGVALGLFKSLR